MLYDPQVGVRRIITQTSQELAHNFPFRGLKVDVNFETYSGLSIKLLDQLAIRGQACEHQVIFRGDSVSKATV